MSPADGRDKLRVCMNVVQGLPTFIEDAPDLRIGVPAEKWRSRSLVHNQSDLSFPKIV
jgi:hypothetical protein